MSLQSSFHKASNAGHDGRAAVRPLQELLRWCRVGDVLLSQLNTRLFTPLLPIPRSINTEPQLLTDVPALDKTNASIQARSQISAPSPSCAWVCPCFVKPCTSVACGRQSSCACGTC